MSTADGAEPGSASGSVHDVRESELQCAEGQLYCMSMNGKYVQCNLVSRNYIHILLNCFPNYVSLANRITADVFL